MKTKIIILLLLCSCNTLWGIAQPNAYSKTAPQLDAPLSLLNCGTNQIIFNWNQSGKAFQLTTIDSLGNIVNIKQHGTDSIDIPYLARRNSNNEIMLMGRTFLYGNTNNRAYVIITDTFGNYKREFSFKPSSVLFNEIYNGLYLNGYYYFIGLQYESSLANLFISKTDTLGNIVWNNSNFPQSNSAFIQRAGFEVTHDKSSLLIGSVYLDSFLVSFPNTEYYSYLLNQVDTNGNFIQRINLPLIDQNQYPSNIVHHIEQYSNNSYLVAGTNDLFILNNNLNIIHHDTILYPMVEGYQTYKNLYNNSYIVGGFKGFTQIYNVDTVFLKDFNQFPDFFKLRDVIPTYDGGYLALLGCDIGTNTRYIKMDCQGNYVNPQWCNPLSILQTNLTLDILLAHQNNQWSLNCQSVKNQPINVQVYNTVGQLIQQTKHKPNTPIINIEHNNLASGIYLIKVQTQSGSITLKAIK